MPANCLPWSSGCPAGGDVMVVKPYEQVGQYGGILRTVTTCQACANDPYFFKKASIFRLNTAATEVLPNIAKGYAFSDDYKTLTITLRQGLKWSDGAPFTADDVLFTWNDIVLNETLTPATPSFWTPGGEVAELVKTRRLQCSTELSSPVPACAHRTWPSRGIAEEMVGRVLQSQALSTEVASRLQCRC